MKKLISFALCALLALALCVPAAGYTDVAGTEWYAGAVDGCTEAGMMNGYTDGSFRPAASVTRAQLVTTLWRLAGQPGTAVDKPSDAPASGFADVADNAWYAPAVRWAVASGVTEGTGGGRFSPDRTVTREMLATFFYRFAGQPEAAGETFADESEIAAWARDAAVWAKASALMQGVGENRFDPKTAATRAQLAQTLMNYAQAREQTPPQRSDYALGADVAPVNVAKGADGALYITDGRSKTVRRVTESGCEKLAGAADGLGGYTDGAADTARFESPWGIAPFLGGWAVSDPENNCVRILRDGSVATANGPAYAYPTGLAADGEGRLYIANTHAGEILLLTPEGKTTVAAAGLDEPMGLCWADGALYIADVGARQILVLRDGALSVLAGSGADSDADGAAAEAGFFAPEGVAVAPDGSVYVSDAAGSAIRRIKNGAVTTLLGQTDHLALTAFPVAPVGLLAEGGTLYVCDRFAGILTALAIG